MVRGQVKWFNKEKGYGFIKYKNLDDIFIHYSNIDMDGYKYLEEGDVVRFNIVETKKGYKATNIILEKKKR